VIVHIAEQLNELANPCLSFFWRYSRPALEMWSSRREIVSRFKAGDESGGALEFAWSLILLMLFEVRLDRDLAKSCISE
jgi:hypothetical protein